MPEKSVDPRPGFQGSETSWVDVTIYQHGNDPVLLSSLGGTFNLRGRRDTDPAHCVVAAQTSKSLGAASGSFVVSLKPSKIAEEIFQWLADDDWVDLVFYRHSQPWHVMRGLVDEVRRSRNVSGTGATSTVYTITGRDFAKVWEITPVWFSPYADNQIVTDAISNQVMQFLPTVIGSPPVAVEAYFRKFLEELSNSAGVNWNPPPGMKGIVDNSFLKSVTFHKANFQNVPARKQFNPNGLIPNGTLWQLAQQHSDPLFTELFVDLLPDGDPMSAKLAAGDALDLGDALMTVVVRDKPFPTAGLAPVWGKLPMFTVPRQQIITSDIGRAGYERFNTYFTAPLLHQESMGQSAINILAPLTNMQEIKFHGMRRMDVQSSIVPDDLDFVKLSAAQRKIIRDWYCLNPYLLSGTINLGVGRPDIRVGCRLKVPSGVNPENDETYYIEQVGQGWQFGKGTRTNLGVTRGWIGDDASYQDKLDEVSAAYKYPGPVTDDIYTA